MSIENKEPKTVLEKIEVAVNCLEQMYLAKMINDDSTFDIAYKKACQLLSDAKLQIIYKGKI